MTGRVDLEVELSRNQHVYRDNIHVPQARLPDHHEDPYLLDRTQIGLPTITVSSDPRRDREKRDRERRRCTGLCCMKWVIFFLVVANGNEIMTWMNHLGPQAVVPAPSIKGDYTTVDGIHDLSSVNIKPRCFRGVVDCPCPDPLIPIEGDGEQWIQTHNINEHLAQSDITGKLDVVFYGDSITEAWRETSLGLPRKDAEGSVQVFETLFRKGKGGKYNGLPLGIAGDTSPMLLWRLQHGELPSSLNPSVFWLLIGTNDIGRSWCSPEMIVLGIIRNVEELLSKRPSAKIVINGLLPRTYNRDGYVSTGGRVKPSVWEDIKAINSELKSYARHRDQVYYFETKAFFKDPKATASQLQIEKTLMPDFLHPSPEGFKVWGEEIVRKLDHLLSDRSQ